MSVIINTYYIFFCQVHPSKAHFSAVPSSSLPALSHHRNSPCLEARASLSTATNTTKAPSTWSFYILLKLSQRALSSILVPLACQTYICSHIWYCEKKLVHIFIPRNIFVCCHSKSGPAESSQCTKLLSTLPVLRGVGGFVSLKPLSKLNAGGKKLTACIDSFSSFANPHGALLYCWIP